MKVRIPLIGIFFLFFLSILVASSPAYAEKVKITKQVIGQFTMLQVTKPALVCRKATEMGTLSKPKLEVGAVWQTYESARVQARLTAIDRKLKKKRSLRSSTLRALTTEKKNIKKLLSAVTKHASRCRSSSSYPDDGEFIGQATSLEPYREHLSEREVQHILDRVAFGGTPQLRQIGKEQGLSALVSALVDGVLSESQRTDFERKADRWADLASWYDSDDLRGKRVWTAQAVQIGEIYRMIYSPEPLREWMTLLLSGHFAVNLNRIGFSYNTYAHQGLPAHVNLIRSQALGSFEELAKGMLTDRAMNEWLDNKNNSAGEPNQNFARELLELFLLGEIDPITHARNYEEESIVASTAYVSGYQEDSARDSVNGNWIMQILYTPSEHDSRSYTVFRGIAGAQVNQSFEPAGFVSYILHNHSGSPRYIAERIAGQVLYPGLTETMVASLASTFKNEQYQMKPFLKRILKSAAFFSNASRGACIDEPVDYFARTARAIFPTQEPASGSEMEERFLYLLWSILDSATDAGQRLFEPPSVFGWKSSCNINRSGEVARGESWASMQRVLGRLRGCGELMNRLNWLEVDFVSQFALTARMGAYEIIEQVRNALGVRALSEQEKSTLAQFMVTELDDQGRRSVRSINLEQEWYVRRKIPRLVCMLLELSSSQVR